VCMYVCMYVLINLCIILYNIYILYMSINPIYNMSYNIYIHLIYI
jgi:hypothetical protein